MSTILHKGGKILKSAVALRVGKAILTKRVLLYGIGIAGIGVLAAVGTSCMVYNLTTKGGKRKKCKTSGFFKKLKHH